MFVSFATSNTFVIAHEPIFSVLILLFFNEINGNL